ncbi:hypothetical protein ACM39_02505 [Chryseobacterium sp. FH2]|uniref:hypothetical protein n=1 Tax=Chryseobacterium sp. FH2 TaxID=1674291 RepID=UPI00065AD708|nr:hypothetical protein [Chryseobacterium sp. FH2]KMQ69931.1 hypothetical protein ACM39_02505 [Chryseobacterium sp. FH2]
MSNIGKIIRVSVLPPIEGRETNVIYQVAAPGAATYTDYAIDENGDLKTHAVVDGTVPLELADQQISITDQESKDNGILSQAQYNADMRKKLDQKLEIPTVEGNAQNYPKIIGLNNNGDIAKLPAGDLGKNMMNADLSNSSARNHTLNAPFSINTNGKAYTLSGLPNKNNDLANFQKVMVQNSNGLHAVIDNKNILLGAPNQLTEAEKTAWKTAMNGGWTTNTMSVASISPVLIKLENEISYVTLKGANLNLNPTSFKIEIMDMAGSTVLATIPNSQIQLDTTGVSLTFYHNFYTLGVNQYKIRLWNGVAYYVTPTTFEVISNINEIDLHNLNWDTKVYNNNVTTKAYAKNNIVYFNPDPSIKSPAFEFDYVFNVKTQLPLFNAGENWYLEMKITSQTRLSPLQSIGLSTSNSVNLINDIFGGLDFSGLGVVTAFGRGDWHYSQDFRLILIKKGQRLTKMLFGIQNSGSNITAVVNENISNDDNLYLGMIFSNMHENGDTPYESFININLMKAYTF